MNLKQAMTRTITQIAAALLFGSIVAAETCLAQTAEAGEIPRENPSVSTSPGTSSSGSVPQGSGTISNLMNRFSNRERTAPNREDVNAFNLLGKHLNATTGGITQGAGFAFGIELTTADLISWVEFRASLLTSTILYRRFEGIAYFPKIGDEHTHAELWFSYLRRTKDNFFGIGPRSPKDFQTNYDLEQRSYNATLYRDFTERFQAGV